MRHIFITGASGGVGIHLASTLLLQRFKCSLQYHSNSSFENELIEKGISKDDFIALQANVTDESQVSDSIKKAVEKFGPIDVLVVCHGIWPTEDVGIVDMNYERFQNTINVNLGGTFLYVKYFLKQLKNAVETKYDLLPPSIVLIGSTAGKYGEAWHADYSCSKSAIMSGFILSLKNEIVKIHPKGRVNTVSPGWIRTPMADRALKDKNLLYQAFATSPLKKVSEPNDITQAILFLADSSKSGNITGVSLDVNAGMEGRLLNTIHDFA